MIVIMLVMINKLGNGFIFREWIYLSIINRDIVINHNMHVGLASKDFWIFPVNK